MSAITKERLNLREEQKRRLEELKKDPFAATPEGKKLIQRIEESIIIRPAKAEKQEPEQEAGSKEFAIPPLSSFALDVIKKNNIPEKVVSEMFKTDQELNLVPGSTMSQIYVESGFNPRAVSKVGAKGLAQVMPKTLSVIQERVGRRLNPFNPIDAITINREIMKENLAKFKKWSSAAIAYNAGWDPSRWGKTKESAQYFSKIKEATAKLFEISKAPTDGIDISLKNNKPM